MRVNEFTACSAVVGRIVTCHQEVNARYLVPFGKGAGLWMILPNLFSPFDFAQGILSYDQYH